MTDLLALVHKQLRFAYEALTADIKGFKDFAQVTPKPESAGYTIAEITDWALGRLNKQRAQIPTADANLVHLIRRANTLTDLTRSWTLYEEDWEQRFMPPRDIPTKALRRRAILAGQELVQKICCETTVCQGLDLDLQCSSIIVVPFLNRLYAGGFDSPAPYIVAPRWGYTQPWNWVAYAHEAGHHVYRSVKGLRDELKVNLIHELVAQGHEYPILSLWYNWLEELFADLFGLLQMGPTFAKTQQYIALSALPSRSIRKLAEGADPRILLLRAHDFTHPTPYLRVDLARKALELSGMLGEATFDRWDHFFNGLEEELTKYVYVQTFELDDGRTILNENRKEKTDTLREIGHQVVQLILETELYSLAYQEEGQLGEEERQPTGAEGKPRKVKDVFSRPLPPVPETEEATELPDDIDIRDAVRWAVHVFERQELDKLKDNSEEIVNRFAPAITVPSVGFERYTAQEGDTIKKMAEKRYGDANKYELIRSANNLGREDKIEPGTEYVIPFFS